MNANRDDIGDVGLMKRIFYEMALRQILDLTEYSDRILDIGCGDKRFTKHLPNAIGLDRVASYNPDIVGDAKEMSMFDDESFGSIHAHSVLEHIDDLELVFSEIYRILRKNGSLIVISPHDLQFSILRFLIGDWSHVFHRKGYHQHDLKRDKIMNYCQGLFVLEKMNFMPSKIFPLLTGVRLRRI